MNEDKIDDKNDNKNEKNEFLVEENQVINDTNDDEEKNYQILSKSTKMQNFIIIFILILLIIIFISLFFILNNKNSGIDKNFQKCETGDEEKCLTCDENKNECSSCNLGYELKNGKCILNYSFKAIYHTNKENENIFLFSNFALENINQMIIDGKEINPTNNYTFSTIGEHTLYLFTNLTGIYFFPLNKMFSGINKMKYITFTNLFDTQHAVTMNGMFEECSSLTSLNISFFDTHDVTDMYSMFQGCSSLTYLNLSSFDTSVVENMEICLVIALL